MRLAIEAAPNPLSIFTTETPGAQLFSMPRSAAMPPKLAPYPTLVGTAITGHPYQAADHARESPLHPGDDDDDASRREAGRLAEQPMDPRDAHVVQAVGLVSEHLGGHGSLFGDRQVRGAACGDEDDAAPRRHVGLAEGDGPGLLLEDGARHHRLHGLVGGPVGPRDEERLAAGDEPLRNHGNLRRLLALPEHNLGQALSERAVMVDPREAEVLERENSEELPEALFSLADVERAVPQVFQNLAQWR